ncbi:hypothetical protein CEXT_460191 [Caerostris extrusa]|uniref:Uncharacterized protein n=1 Tax=Caerostris extrusa TaxID=172846 RepID=A0AAV4WEW1_CAEEX|nr:hypothetical protein CEXT_460191 [Caerostris extrusa]
MANSAETVQPSITTGRNRRGGRIFPGKGKRYGNPGKRCDFDSSSPSRLNDLQLRGSCPGKRLLFPAFLCRKRCLSTSRRWFYGPKNGLVAICYSAMSKVSAIFPEIPRKLSGRQIRQKPCTTDNHWKKQERGGGEGAFFQEKLRGSCPRKWLLFPDFSVVYAAFLLLSGGFMAQRMASWPCAIPLCRKFQLSSWCL